MQTSLSHGCKNCEGMYEAYSQLERDLKAQKEYCQELESQLRQEESQSSSVLGRRERELEIEVEQMRQQSEKQI